MVVIALAFGDANASDGDVEEVFVGAVEGNDAGA